MPRIVLKFRDMVDMDVKWRKWVLKIKTAGLPVCPKPSKFCPDYHIVLKNFTRLILLEIFARKYERNPGLKG